MKHFIGRPPDKSTEELICPRCRNKELRKAGFRQFHNQKATRNVRAYRCRLCYFQTTKPLRG